MEAGGDGEECVGLIHDGGQPPDVAHHAVQQHVQQASYRKDQCEKGESLSFPLSHCQHRDAEQADPQDGPVAEVFVVVGLAVVDEIKIEHVQIRGDGAGHGGEGDRSGGDRDSAQFFQKVAGQKIAGGEVGDEHANSFYRLEVFLEALWLMSSRIAPPATLLRRKRSGDDVAQGAAGGDGVERVAGNQQ